MGSCADIVHPRATKVPIQAKLARGSIRDIGQIHPAVESAPSAVRIMASSRRVDPQHRNKGSSAAIRDWEATRLADEEDKGQRGELDGQGSQGIRALETQAGAGVDSMHWYQCMQIGT
jgi:hypothetical protein